MSESDLTKRAREVLAGLSNGQRDALVGLCWFVRDDGMAGQFTNSTFPLRVARRLCVLGLSDWDWMGWEDDPYRADGRERSHRRGYFPTDLGREVARLVAERSAEVTS